MHWWHSHHKPTLTFTHCTLVAAEEAAPEGGAARTAIRPARRLPSHIFSHAPAALTARGAPVQIWQPWEVSIISARSSLPAQCTAPPLSMTCCCRSAHCVCTVKPVTLVALSGFHNCVATCSRDLLHVTGCGGFGVVCDGQVSHHCCPWLAARCCARQPLCHSPPCPTHVLPQPTTASRGCSTTAPAHVHTTGCKSPLHPHFRHSSAPWWCQWCWWS